MEAGWGSGPVLLVKHELISVERVREESKGLVLIPFDSLCTLVT